MSNQKTFNEKVKEVNKMLKDFGAEAVQKYTTSSSFEACGYKPQYILDSVNEVFGATGWRYNVVSLELHTYSTANGREGNIVSAEVEVQFLNNDGSVYYTTGRQFGGSRVVSGGFPDAKKGAITDAVGKALSLLSIGSDAYRGTVSKEYKDKDIHMEPGEEVAVSNTVSKSRFALKPKAPVTAKSWKKPETPSVESAANSSEVGSNVIENGEDTTAREVVESAPAVSVQTIETTVTNVRKPLFKSKLLTKTNEEIVSNGTK